MTAAGQSASSPAAWAGLAMYGAIGAIAFAVSLDHAHKLFTDHGQDGWVGKALAVVVVLLAVGSVFEGVRRVRAKETLGPVIAAVLIGVGIEAWGNLATAEDNLAGYLIAAVPTIVTLIVLWAMESARSAARRRREAVEEDARREAEMAHRRTTAAEEQRAAAAADRQARADAERAAEDARVAAQAEVDLAQARAAEAAQLAEAERLRAATEAAQRRAQAEAQEAQRRQAQAAQAEAQRRAQEAAQRAEADRLKREREEEDRRSKLPPPPAPGTEAHAVEVALSHRTEAGELPGPTELSRLSGTSLATAKRALKKIRETPEAPFIRLVPSTA